jgi:ABC-type bacteriocin/lantibiotic exporter with double-glycine peptidase domain
VILTTKTMAFFMFRALKTLTPIFREAYHTQIEISASKAIKALETIKAVRTEHYTNAIDQSYSVYHTPLGRVEVDLRANMDETISTLSGDHSVINKLLDAASEL